jgi:hypothetical protein
VNVIAMYFEYSMVVLKIPQKVENLTNPDSAIPTIPSQITIQSKKASYLNCHTILLLKQVIIRVATSPDRRRQRDDDEHDK